MEKSESIKELAAALSNFQGEATDAIKDKKGDKNNKYADLGQILNLVRPTMAKHGLAIAQLPCECVDPASVAVDTMLMHKSGEWISNKFSMPINRIIRAKDGKDITNAPQASGSVITYARRYALAAVLGITQEDNDAALQREQQAEQSKAANEPKISAEQVAVLWPWMTTSEPDGSNVAWSERGSKILTEYRLSQVDDLPASKFEEVKIKLGVN